MISEKKWTELSVCIKRIWLMFCMFLYKHIKVTRTPICVLLFFIIRGSASVSRTHVFIQLHDYRLFFTSRLISAHMLHHINNSSSLQQKRGRMEMPDHRQVWLNGLIKEGAMWLGCHMADGALALSNLRRPVEKQVKLWIENAESFPKVKAQPYNGTEYSTNVL